MNAAQKASKARLRYADRAEQTDAWNAAYDALESVQDGEPMDMMILPSQKYTAAGWPISGDDLALAKAGRIA